MFGGGVKKEWKFERKWKSRCVCEWYGGSEAAPVCQGSVCGTAALPSGSHSAPLSSTHTVIKYWKQMKTVISERTLRSSQRPRAQNELHSALRPPKPTALQHEQMNNSCKNVGSNDQGSVSTVAFKPDHDVSQTLLTLLMVKRRIKALKDACDVVEKLIGLGS